MLYNVAAFYRFFPFADYMQARNPIKSCMASQGLKGNLLLAPEGINATVAGSREGLSTFFTLLVRLHPSLANLEIKWNVSDHPPFKRARVRLKKELIAFGQPTATMQKTGLYADAETWNQLISDPETLVLDTRNTYEIERGTFKNAVNPNIRHFSHLPAYTKDHLDPTKHKRIATFCTGGIRCEKFTSFLLEQGFEEVYQLKGGILQYLNDTNKEESLWEGECFVFDDRGAVD